MQWEELNAVFKRPIATNWLEYPWKKLRFRDKLKFMISVPFSNYSYIEFYSFIFNSLVVLCTSFAEIWVSRLQQKFFDKTNGFIQLVSITPKRILKILNGNKMSAFETQAMLEIWN